jgi:hypothetical protein
MAACSGCPAGKYSSPSPSTGYAECEKTECFPGQYSKANAVASRSDNSEVCFDCPANKYRNSTMDSCAPTECPTGKDSPAAATTKSGFCQTVKEYTCPVANSVLNETHQCVCARGFFGRVSLGKCKQCPHHSSCPHEHTSVEGIILDKGYWRTGSSSEQIIPCPRDGVCTGGVDSKCAKGNMGPLCMVCAHNYSLSSSSVCTECTPTRKAATQKLLICVILALLAMLSTYSYYQREAGTGRLHSCFGKAMKLTHLDRLTTILQEKAGIVQAKSKIVLSFVQVIGQLKQVYNIPYPTNFLHLSDAFSSANPTDVTTMVQFGCLATFDYNSRLVTMTLLPLALSAVLLFKHRSAEKHHDQDQKNRCVGWFLKLTYLVFPGVSTIVLQAYTCIPFDTQKSYLKADLSIGCDGTGRTLALSYAVLMTLVYPIGITVLYTVLLWRQRVKICPMDCPTVQWWSVCGIHVFPPKLTSEKEEQELAEKRNRAIEEDPDLSHIAFLFKEYKPTYWWFEAFQCTQRLMLTGGSVIFLQGSATQVVCGCLVALLAIHTNSICKPFIVAGDNVLALSAVWGIFFTLFGGLLLKLNLGQADGYTNYHGGFGNVLVFVNAMVIVIALGIGGVIVKYLKLGLPGVRAGWEWRPWRRRKGIDAKWQSFVVDPKDLTQDSYVAPKDYHRFLGDVQMQTFHRDAGGAEDDDISADGDAGDYHLVE